MVAVKPLKMRPVNAASKRIIAQWGTPHVKEARRDHDAKFATFWRRLGFGKPVPVFSWTAEDEMAATLSAQIAAEIDRETSLVGWKSYD